MFFMIIIFFFFFFFSDVFHIVFGQIQCGEGMGNGAPMFGSHMDGILTQISAGGDVGASLPGTARPRVRARRGQATDPHSIAERV